MDPTANEAPVFTPVRSVMIQPYGMVHYGPCPVDDPSGKALAGTTVTMDGTLYKVAAYDFAGPAPGPGLGETVGLLLRPADACGCDRCAP